MRLFQNIFILCIASFGFDEIIIKISHTRWWWTKKVKNKIQFCLFSFNFIAFGGGQIKKKYFGFDSSNESMNFMNVILICLPFPYIESNHIANNMHYIVDAYSILTNIPFWKKNALTIQMKRQIHVSIYRKYDMRYISM